MQRVNLYIYLAMSVAAILTAVAVHTSGSLDTQGLFMTIFVIISTLCLFALGDSLNISPVIQKEISSTVLYQLFIVSGVFLIAVVVVFVFSWWAVHVGITTHELSSDLKPDDNDANTANTIVIANALIWSFTLLMITTYILSRIGFQMSQCALSLILLTVDKDKPKSIPRRTTPEILPQESQDREYINNTYLFY
jgi:hypothetical protein